MTNKELTDRKKQYNELLLRHEKAVMYLDDTKVPAMQKEKWLPEFQRLVEDLNYIIGQIENTGYYVTVPNIVNGFVVEESEGVE